MKKIGLKIGSVKEMLTKEQMKKISGGDSYNCTAVGGSYSVNVVADNCCGAQAGCDYVAFMNSFTNSFPNGGDVPCDMVC